MHAVKDEINDALKPIQKYSTLYTLCAQTTFSGSISVLKAI
jgi:hypothetical protein